MTRLTQCLLLYLFLLSSCSQAVPGETKSAPTNPNQPQLRQAFLVKPDILALRIDASRVEYGQQIPYQSQWGDRLKQGRTAGENWVIRQGRTIGGIVGKQGDRLQTFDRVVGDRLDPQWADRTTSYQIISQEDPDYSAGIQPIAVFRKSKPTDMARVEPWKFEFPLTHVLYLKLPTHLKAGKTYQINLPGGTLGPISFKYDPLRSPSEAVQVSHLGFAPEDTAKVAFLSTWMGNGGKVTYPEGLNFSVVDQKTNQAVFTGRTQLTKKAEDPEDRKGRNYTLTNVYSMDFSRFQTPGQYRVCVAQVGCSLSFPISSKVWQEAFYISARGLYHQRSGIELKPPYTTFQRPRAFHPDDGVQVYDASISLADVDQGIGKADFGQVLGSRKTDRIVPNSWGGYFDAGDWDRRIQHIEVARLLLELAELFPNYYDRVNLNIPESQNAFPDIVDEALWGLDFYRRLQTADGGIRGGIQSQLDPKFGEGSWQESFLVLAYAPDAWSSYIYAGGAARAAHWLQAKDAKLAQVYRDSAFKAVAYAERTVKPLTSIPWRVRDARNLAAAELLRLTREAKWQQIFRETTVFKDPNQETAIWDQHNQRDAAFLYARLPTNLVDPTIQRHAKTAIVREADTAIATGANTAFRWIKEHPDTPVGWGNGLGAPKAISVVRAHYLTGSAKYWQATLLGSQFSLGANPDNMTYTTGLGHRSPQHPLVIDQRVSGQAPPPGITVYGPYDPQADSYGDFWTIGLFQDVMFPAPKTWPTVESYVDIFLFPMATEFTVMESIAPTAYIWGYLAAQRSMGIPSTTP